MPVILRKSKIKNGYSFYFDISHKAKRWTEWIKVHIKGDPKTEENKDKIQLAKKMRIERERELTVLGKGLPNEMKVRERDFFDVYDELVVNRIRAPHIYQNIRKKIRLFAGEGFLPICAIDKSWLMRYLSFLKGEGIAGNTVHQYFCFMGTILREANCMGYIVTDPYNLISRQERTKLKRGKADHLSQEELDSFIQCETKRVDAQLKQMFLFSCFTGLRWSDCQRIKWANIRQIMIEGKNQRVIILTQKKTDEQVIVPLNPSALSLLEVRENEIKQEIKSPHIFPKWSEESTGKSNQRLRGAMSYEMRKWSKQVGFERKFKFHLARHTYASWLIQNGVDLYTVSKLLGHADMSATVIYAHVSDQVKIFAAEKFPKVNINKRSKPGLLTIAA